MEPDRAWERGNFFVNFSASSGAAIEVPPGLAVIQLFWPNFSTKAVFKVMAAPSVDATYVQPRKSDGTGAWSPYDGTSASTAGNILLADLSGAKYLKIVIDASFGKTYRFSFMGKA